MIDKIPSELALSGVYLSPLLVVFFLALGATLMTTVLLNKLRVSQYILHIPLAFLAMLTLYIVLIDAYFIKI